MSCDRVQIKSVNNIPFYARQICNISRRIKVIPLIGEIALRRRLKIIADICLSNFAAGGCRVGLLFDNNRISVIKPSVLLRAHHDTPLQLFPFPLSLFPRSEAPPLSTVHCLSLIKKDPEGSFLLVHSAACGCCSGCGSFVSLGIFLIFCHEGLGGENH